MFARVTTSGQLGTVASTPPSTTWTFTNRGGPGVWLIGSPVANNLGAFLVGNTQSGWRWAATKQPWAPLGGYVDR